METLDLRRRALHGCRVVALFSLALTLMPAAWAQAALPGKPHPAPVAVDDAADDPPGVLDELDTGYIVELGERLSADRTWLSDEALAMLDDIGLRLDELFAGVPEFFTKDGGDHYRIKIEKVGSLWGSFDPASDPFAIFLTHEAYTGLGLDRVLAFMDGAQTVLFERDLETLPALALTIESHPPGRPIAKSASVGSFEQPVELGSARLDLRRFDAELVAGFPLVPAMKAGCSHEVAPTSCNGMRPVCAAGASLHFILSALKIRTDHEGFGKGNPEIELFPFNIDGASTGSTSNRSTPFIFDGRTIADSAGRSRFLADVNNTNVWYSLGKGVAICPATLGGEWAMTLVEQDDTTGVLMIKGDRTNTVKMMRFENPSSSGNTVQIYPFNALKFVFQFIKLLFGLWSGDGDDLYQESIGLTGNLFCNDGLGKPAPKIFNLASAEWDMQGYFACVNPSCAEMNASISGPSSTFSFSAETFTASVTSGSTPFTYQWLKDGALVGTGSSVTVSSSSSYTLTLTVTDASGQRVTATMFVFVDDGMCGDFFC